MKPHRVVTRGFGRLAFAALLGASLAVPARAAEQVPRQPAGPPQTIDVWTNKEEGGVYSPGEGMRIFFRSSADAFVLLYNIDTDGYIHLIYPYVPSDPERVEGGRTYQIPSRRDPYDLVADGPPGMEFVVAVASPVPFADLPWYLMKGVGDGGPAPGEEEDETDTGVISGDPYVAMGRILDRIAPTGHEDDVATSDTYFYIDRRVDYPRYVCADCHGGGVFFDPYRDACPVVVIRIDATWAHYARIRPRLLRPRYYYTVRGNAPDRYRRLKDRWSTLDGRTTLRERFHVEATPKDLTRRDRVQQRTPPEFQDLRRYRPGRFWQGRDQVLKLREQRQRERADQRRQQVERERQRAQDLRDRARERGDNGGDRAQQPQQQQQQQQERRRDNVERQRDSGNRGNSGDRQDQARQRNERPRDDRGNGRQGERRDDRRNDNRRDDNGRDRNRGR
ncbi:MAG: DUF4384 domain-containing protein [Hyphomicrobiales bacterium]